MIKGQYTYAGLDQTSTAPGLPDPMFVPDNPCMDDRDPYRFDIRVETRFVPHQSRPDGNRFVFAYTITLRNTGEMPAQLVSRHWVIADANGKVEEVRGEGVIGEQPWMRPGDDFQYTSGAVLETPVGTMHGSYQMLADDGTRFEAPIAPFTLTIPRTLH